MIELKNCVHRFEGMGMRNTEYFRCERCGMVVSPQQVVELINEVASRIALTTGVRA